MAPRGRARKVPAANVSLTAKESVLLVANAFVEQYYHILEKSPELVYRFYKDISKVSRPGDNGLMSTATTTDGINKKILEFGKFSAHDITMEAQESHDSGVFIIVLGYLTRNKDDLGKKFTQSFFLAPQVAGYFVLNDVLNYVDGSPAPQNCLRKDNHQSKKKGKKSVAEVERPSTPQPESSSSQENAGTEPVNTVSEDVSEEEVRKPSENGEVPIKEEEAPIPAVVDKIPDDSKEVAESNSIVKLKKEGNVPISIAAAAGNARSVPENQGQQVTAAAASATVSETENENNLDAETSEVFLFFSNS